MAAVSDDVCLKERPAAWRRSFRQPPHHGGHDVDQGTGSASPAAEWRAGNGTAPLDSVGDEAAPPRVARSGPLRLAAHAFHRCWAVAVAAMFLLSFRERDWT